MSRLGDCEEKITNALYKAVDEAPLNYSTASLLASCFGLFVNFRYPDSHPVVWGTFPILFVTIPALLTTIGVITSLLGDTDKLLAYSEDFTQEPQV